MATRVARGRATGSWRTPGGWNTIRLGDPSRELEAGEAEGWRHLGVRAGETGGCWRRELQRCGPHQELERQRGGWRRLDRSQATRCHSRLGMGRNGFGFLQEEDEASHMPQSRWCVPPGRRARNARARIQVVWSWRAAPRLYRQKAAKGMGILPERSGPWRRTRTYTCRGREKGKDPWGGADTHRVAAPEARGSSEVSAEEPNTEGGAFCRESPGRQGSAASPQESRGQERGCSAGDIRRGIVAWQEIGNKEDYEDSLSGGCRGQTASGREGRTQQASQEEEEEVRKIKEAEEVQQQQQIQLEELEQRQQPPATTKNGAEEAWIGPSTTERPRCRSREQRRDGRECRTSRRRRIWQPHKLLLSNTPQRRPQGEGERSPRARHISPLLRHVTSRAITRARRQPLRAFYRRGECPESRK